MAAAIIEYGLFLAKAVTVVVAVAVLVGLVAGLARRRPPEGLEVRDLNKRYQELTDTMQTAMQPRSRWKRLPVPGKRPKQEPQQRPRVFVMDFRGDVQASDVASLREEVTAILGVATKDDEVVVRLESYGGLVHDYGLATSQLLRLKEHGVPLTVVVDKVAASGGYMMACVADRILAAPFAVVGSVGVLAQIPNFHRLLDEHGVSVEQFKVGDAKRTVTMLGENTEGDRARLREKLAETHRLFTDLVAHYRPGLDMNRVGSGDHWYGQQALDLKLVDELSTSDAYLVEASTRAWVYEVAYKTRQPLTGRLTRAVRTLLPRGLTGSRSPLA